MLHFTTHTEEKAAGHRVEVPKQRTEMVRRLEEKILERAPGTVLVLFKAAPEVLAKRMKEKSHTHQIVREIDIHHVLKEVFRGI